MRLEYVRFIVTGAAQGMGRHFALKLAEAGGQVAAGDVNEAGLAALADEAKALAGKVHTRKLDVGDEADVELRRLRSRGDGRAQRAREQRGHPA
jgi:3-oxoacyl-[acyl-carrier protein] reductase